MNRTKTRTGWIAFLLTVAMILAVMTACTSKNDPANETTTTKSSTTAQSGEEATTSDSSDPITVKFNGEEIKFLCWSNCNIAEYYDNYEDVEGTVLELAIWQRRETTCENLRLDAIYLPIVQDEYMSTARAGHMAGNTYDGYIVYSSHAATMAMEGMIANLTALPYFNFNNPWYPSQLTSECSLFGNLYFCSGDLSTNSLFMSTLIYFNKDIYKANNLDAKVSSKYGYDSVYDLVRNKAWSFDVLKTLAKNIYADSDGNGMLSKGDTYGFGTYSEELDSFYYSADFTTITSDDEGMHLSSNFTNSGMISNILTKVGSFLHESGDAYLFSDHGTAREAFAAGRTLFHMGPASHAYKVFRNTDGLTYGVLPVPMFEEGEENYKCTMSFGYCMYCIDNKSSAKEMCAAYIEELGRQSYLITRPVIFESTMKLRYADLPDDSEMWDIIIDAQSYDLGRVFCQQIGSTTGEQPLVLLFRNLLKTNSTDWSSTISGNKTLLNNYIDDINAKLREMK